MTAPPPPGFPPPAPKQNRTNALIVGAAAVLIVAIVGTGLFVAHSRDDKDGATSGPASSTSAAVTPTPSASLSPECRTWIKSELLDSTESIEATPGYTACGYLSDAELDAAIKQVTAELSAEITPSAP